MDCALDTLDRAIAKLSDTIQVTEQELQEIIIRRDLQRAELATLLGAKRREAFVTTQIDRLLTGSSHGATARTVASSQAGRWSSAFDWDINVVGLLETLFECSDFRPFQREVINATLSGQDVFVVMRTGNADSSELK